MAATCLAVCRDPLARGRRLAIRLGVAVTTAVAASVSSVGAAAPVHACAACVAETDASITGQASGQGFSYVSGYGQYNVFGDCAIAGTAASLPAEECGVSMWANYSFPTILQGTSAVSLYIYASSPLTAFDRSYSCTATLVYDVEGPDNGAIGGTCTETFSGGASRTVQLTGHVLVTWGDFSPVYLPLNNGVQAAIELTTVAS